MLKKRVETIVSGATDAVTGALDARANSIAVRPDAECLKRIDELGRGGAVCQPRASRGIPRGGGYQGQQRGVRQDL